VNGSELDAEAFEKLVIEELDLLPDEMVEDLENVAFVTLDRPADGTLSLLGEYDGVDITRRGNYGFGELPDRIVLYREPLLSVSRDLAELRDQVHVTLVHEIAHYFGIGDEELHDLGWGLLGADRAGVLVPRRDPAAHPADASPARCTRP
jgi:predicted Zn-dependent protease with MMP-like domain